VALDIYQAVTDRIIELLDRGTVPWRHPIINASGDARTKKLLFDKGNRNINTFLLAVIAYTKGYKLPYQLTYRQDQEGDGHGKKARRREGERARGREGERAPS